MRVGLSLLTLVPGISGGSETYARELCRALARVGSHAYEALVPTLAPDAADGLEATVATGYRASTAIPGRLRAMAAAAVRPGGLRDRLERADVVHYPLTVPVPPVDRPAVVTLLDVQHLDLPRLFPRGERAFRRLAYDRAARRADRVIVISEWVRGRVIERLGLAEDRVHAIHLAVDHDRFVPDPTVARETFLYYPARPWAHKNHARLFAAFDRLRAARPRPTARSDGRRPRAGRATGRRGRARRRPARRADRPLPPRGRGGVPEPLRGVRAAAARGDGLRLPGRGLECGLATRGGGRRGRAVRPHRRRRDRRRRRRGARPLDRARIRGARQGRRPSRGTRPRAPTTASTSLQRASERVPG